MTPKEKAQELFNKFYQTIDIYNFENVKNAALIAVDEILELEETQEEYQIQYDNGEYSREIGYKYSKYWLDVKKEIEAL
jgi:hypothetical protein